MRLPQDRILHIDMEFKDGRVNIVAEWQGELVLCKDCKHYKKINPKAKSGICYKDIVASAWNDDGFCSRGERKGGEEYEKCVEQMEHDIMYEPTYNQDDGSM